MSLEYWLLALLLAGVDGERRRLRTQRRVEPGRGDPFAYIRLLRDAQRVKLRLDEFAVGLAC